MKPVLSELITAELERASGGDETKRATLQQFLAVFSHYLARINRGEAEHQYIELPTGVDYLPLSFVLHHGLDPIHFSGVVNEAYSVVKSLGVVDQYAGIMVLKFAVHLKEQQVCRSLFRYLASKRTGEYNLYIHSSGSKGVHVNGLVIDRKRDGKRFCASVQFLGHWTIEVMLEEKAKSVDEGDFEKKVGEGGQVSFECCGLQADVLKGEFPRVVELIERQIRF